MDAFERHCTSFYNTSPPPASSAAVLSALASLQSGQPMSYDHAHARSVEETGLLSLDLNLAPYVEVQGRARREAHEAMAKQRREAFRFLVEARVGGGGSAPSEGVASR